MIAVILTLAVIGFLLALLFKIPMLEPFKNIILFLVIICVILWLLKLFGIADIPIPKYH